MIENVTPTWVKRLTQTVGTLLMLPGMLTLSNLLCVIPLMLFSGVSYSSLPYGVFSLLAVLLTFAVGLTAWRLAESALKGSPSRALKLPPVQLLMIIFAALLILALIIRGANIAPILFFPPLLLVLAALPPLWAVSWFLPPPFPQDPTFETDPDLPARQTTPLPADLLTWRRGLMAFIGGGTLGVLLALLLEILLPAILLALVFGLSATIMDSLESLLSALFNNGVASALTNPTFFYFFIELALIAPLAEELAKPLAILPLVKRLDQKQTFWLGALAGAGFAALENVIFVSAGQSYWAGVLLLRALGGALHPLCAGLVALGWRAVLLKQPDAGKQWLLRFGSAFLIHAVWNGGSLLVITLVGTNFFGGPSPSIDLLGLSTAGATLAFLLLLGLSTLWLGRIYGHGQSFPFSAGDTPSGQNDLLPSDRALAIWALACLAAIVPVGIAGLKLWLR